MPGQRGSEEERFRRYFKEGSTTDCWEWRGSKNIAGYGILRIGGRAGWSKMAHRIAYEVHYGVELPRGRWPTIMHTCDNPPCVNPHHLRAGTQSENLLDAYRKGRKTYARNSANNPPLKQGEDHYKAKLTDRQVLAIRALFAAGQAVSEIAKYFPVKQTTIYKIVRGEIWRHI